MVRRNILECCALAHLSIEDDSCKEEIEWEINKMKSEKEDWFETGEDGYGKGQRACFVIVSPFEFNLERNLKKLGFKLIETFERRVGYPKNGDLKMYFLKW